MAEFIPAVRTRATGADLSDLLRAGHQSKFGFGPPAERLNVALAHVALETNRGKSIWCWNFGNLKCSSRYTGLCCTIPVPEGSREPAAQRAYVGPVEGAADYWRLLDSDRYRGALLLFDQGRAYDAGAELGRAGWHTTDPDAYGSRMAALYDELGRKGTIEAPPDYALPVALLGGLTAAAVVLYYWTR